MKTLYLHIGTMKTGTSAIQDFLYHNKDYLEENNFVYPRNRHKYEGISKRRNGAFLGSPAYIFAKENESEDKSIVDKELMSIEDSFRNHDNVIISEETAWHRITAERKEAWKKLVDYMKDRRIEIKVIVYLRRQDLFMESYWKQLVKHNKYRWSFQHCIKYRSSMIKLDYISNLEDIATNVGEENILVKRYQEGSLIEGDIVIDFLTALGLPIDNVKEGIINKERRNTSISYNATEIARQLNNIPTITKEQSRRYEHALNTISEIERKRKEEWSIFGIDGAQNFVEQYEDGNKMVASKYIGDGRPLFDDVYKNREKWDKGNPYLMEDFICFMGTALTDILDKMEMQEKTIKEMENKKKKRTIKQYIQKIRQNITL